MRSLGIVIREADVQQRLLETGQADLEGQARLTAVAQATLDLAYEQSGDAVGDFSRTSDSAANQLRQLRSDATDAAVEIGENLLPALVDIIGAARDMTERFAGLSEGQQQLVLTFAGIAAAAGPATVAVGALGTAITFIAANPIVAGAAAAIAGVTLAITGLTRAGRESRGALADLAEELGTSTRDLDRIARDIERFEDATSAFGDSVPPIEEGLRDIAESAGRTVIEVARIGVESTRISDEYRAQLQAVIAQEETRQAQIAAELELNSRIAEGRNIHMEQSAALRDQEETLQRQLTITEAINGVLSDSRANRIDLQAIDALILSGSLSEEEGLERKVALRDDEIERLREQLLLNESLLLQSERTEDQADAVRDRLQVALDAQISAQQGYYDRLNELRQQDDEIDEEVTVNQLDRIRAVDALVTAGAISEAEGIERSIRLRDQAISQLREQLVANEEQLIQGQRTTEQANEARDAILAALDEQLSAQQEYYDSIDTLQADNHADTIARVREQIDIYRTLGSSITNILGAITGAENARLSNYRRQQEEQTDLLEQQTQGQIQAARSRADAEIAAQQEISDSETQAAEDRIEELDEQLERDRERIQRNVTDQAFAAQQIMALEMSTTAQVQQIRDQLAIDQEARTSARELREEELAEYIAALEADLAEETERIEEETDQTQRRIQRRQAARQKAISLFNIGINTAQGVISALSLRPPNIPLSVVIAGAGVAQAAIVASTPLPELAQGGFFSGPALIGEAGREFAFPIDGPQGQSAMSLMADRLVDSMSRSGPTTNNQNVTINSTFSLGTEQEQRRAARALFPALENEARRRGVRISS